MWLISSWFLAYAVSILGIIFGIQRLRALRSGIRETIRTDDLTVIVPFRNESAHLRQFMECIYRQKYQPAQWIFVNDHSTDIFLPFFEEMGSFPIRLLHLPEDQEGKKRAIRFGMDHTSTDYCLTMDADITFGREYMKQLMAVPAADLVILPVEMTSRRWWHPFFTLEYLFTVLLNRGTAGWSRPVNASGANLLIHLPTFEAVDDIDNHEHIPSGDDIYTLRAFRESGKHVEIIETPELTVYTPTPLTISQVMEQRVRWLGKTGHVGDYLNSFLGIWAVALHMAYFLLLILTWFSPYPWIALLIVLAKAVLDAMLIHTYGSWTATRITGLLLFELFYPLYLFGLLGSALFTQPEWKGR